MNFPKLHAVRRKLSTPVTYPAWFAIISMILLGFLAVHALRIEVDKWLFTRVIEDCAKRSPAPCHWKGATMYVTPRHRK